MSVSIRKIYIENFRSIRRLDIDTRQLSIFVGKNDSGKSNILRAINLFFNGETNPRKEMIFSEDFNFNYTPSAKKAKEITVRLEIDIPENYHGTNGDLVIWEKKWRVDGLHIDNYHGVRISRGQRGAEKRETVEIPARSNLHSLLRNIEYQYIPAVKDSHFFDDLRGKIYRIISEVADDTFRASSATFEDSIGEHLGDLTSDIMNALGFKTRLALPRDLSSVFQRLDFLSGINSVSLENRGDGIKARHIPLILKFMADKKRSLQVRGSMPYSFIWGYEEPENNLELTNCVHLADEFWKYARDNVAQVLLTTHSPVFYNLQEKNSANFSASCYHIYRENEQEGTVATQTQKVNDLDEKMGLMMLLAPKIRELEEKVRELDFARLEAERLAQSNRLKIFVEGESDKTIIKRALELFSPDYSASIDIVTKPDGAGHGYVEDMLIAWRSRHKHHPNSAKAAGIVDNDEVGNKVRKKWNEVNGNTQSCKCFKYNTPVHLRSALQAGFKIPVTLETLYPKQIWDWALEKRYLVERNLADTLPIGIHEKILRGESTLSEHIAETEWEIYLRYDCNNDYKKRFASYVAQKPDQEAREFLANFESIVSEVVGYLSDNQT